MNNNNELKQLKYSLVALSILFTLLALFIFIGFFASQRMGFLSYMSAKDSNEYVLKILQFFATSFGGIAILFNVYYSAKRSTAMERTAQATEKNIEVAQNSQITERFTKAVEQLGSENLSIRIGGIYALEKIAQDAPKTYHWTIMEILCAFIRNHELSWEKNVTKPEVSIIKKNRDLETALIVIGRRNTKHDPENIVLDLRGTDLSFTNLNNGKYDFSKAIFLDSSLTSVQWNNVVLETVKLYKSNLREAIFIKCSFKEADLKNTYISGAEFFNCNLQKANFMGGKISDTMPLFLTNSKIQGTIFYTVLGLTQENIDDAIGDETTILPEHLEMPENWKNK